MDMSENLYGVSCSGLNSTKEEKAKYNKTGRDFLKPIGPAARLAMKLIIKEMDEKGSPKCLKFLNQMK